jgi:hypothetical protein
MEWFIEISPDKFVVRPVRKMKSLESFIITDSDQYKNISFVREKAA